MTEMYQVLTNAMLYVQAQYLDGHVLGEVRQQLRLVLKFVAMESKPVLNNVMMDQSLHWMDVTTYA